MTVAASLAGAVTPLDLQWLSPILCTLPVDAFNEDVGLPLVDFDPTERILDADQIALADVLEDTEAHPSADEEDPCDVEEDPKNAHSVDFVWQIPFVSSIKIWPYLVTFAPQSLAVDRLDINTDTLIVHGVFARRVREPQDGFPRQTFEADDYERLASPTARLNDTCVNGCSALLYSEFLSSAAAQCAILSTHDLPRVRYHAQDDALWHNISWTRYWEKPTWILPIHCPSPVGHWVVCIIKFTLKQLLLFDSLAEQRPWKHDIKVFECFCPLRSLTIHRILCSLFLACPLLPPRSSESFSILWDPGLHTQL